MDFFRISGNEMNSLIEQFNVIKEGMNECNEKVKQLYVQIESEKEWTGEGADTFLAFLNLMSQYQSEFVSVGDFAPLDDAEKALKALKDNVNSFYTDYAEYIEMGNIV